MTMRRRYFTLMILPLLLAVGPSLIQAESLYKTENIFEPTADSPEHAHASCIVECPNGDLLAVWYENGVKRDDYYYTKDGDKSDDVRIGAARRITGQSKWSEPFVISDTFGVSDNNPCMVIDAEERLWLIHSAMLGAPIHTWNGGTLRFMVSSDYQKPGPPRWSYSNILVVHPNGLDEVVARNADLLRRNADHDNPFERMATRLLEGLNDPYSRRLGWMPRAHPLILKDGTLLLPLANENFSVASMAMTKDAGQTWTISRAVPGGRGVIQPSVVQLPSGKLIAFFRDSGDQNRIQRSESSDNGYTWSVIQPTSLPNPGSGVEAILLQDGDLAMVYNDKEDSPRDRLALSISEDEGQTWKWTRHIENSPGERFDYPSIVQSTDGSLHVSYTYNTKTIKHAHFNVEWVKDDG